MELKINIVEAAAELAELRVIEDFTVTNKSLSKKGVEKLVYVTDTKTNTTTYTPEAQDLFEAHYDLIFELLINCKVKEDDKSTD